MSRYFAPLSEADFRAKLRAAFANHPEIVSEYDPTEIAQMSEEELAANAMTLGAMNTRVFNDLSKVNFDFENCYTEKSEMDYHDDPNEKLFVGVNVLPNGMPYLGAFVGGDWEKPTHIIVYYDGKTLRGYVPTEGNTWNLDTKTAYGSEDYPEDHIFAEDGVPEDQQRKFDYAALIADIQGRIKPKA